MRKSRKNNGFSLTEVLLGVGTLAVGMIFVAGVFPVGIYFATTATERTIAAVVADEAFAKIRLYGESDLDFQIWLSAEPLGGCVDFNDVVAPNPDEFAYPSSYVTQKQYYWSALCRRIGDTRLVQVTVFVCRKIGPGPGPGAVQVGVSPVPGVGHENELTIGVPEDTPLINDGYTIVDNESGRLYRVLERDVARPDTIILDRPWQGGPAGLVWVVPPPAGGGRYPCIAVYQKVIGF